ncbi:hypothetical protein VOLCADRAFT_118174 [Volvox carteri f. nagariensis]|uniref:Uncharacterized protein n=1 Tax=Volvox carteri f. nagariensis TaxID=3068 RepID=D8U2H2_VOLCA|nr:uncharacterized protein VOLCADRAFT_118174 [Volvox carteri f. nagariensis]EFJ46132.1 hypothetical protein VOLCADRAFT_118174 [Volvox carteri f. nagariensis]|eukprot:XP_002952882.1 hypothetical protein VOLCADRAFT_118174 [Volvox carteri f. nagariensis]
MAVPSRRKLLLFLCGWCWCWAAVAIQNEPVDQLGPFRGSSNLNAGEQLRTCWNALYDPAPVGYTDWLAGGPARLYLVDVWWPARPSNLPMTVFTMASMDRLHLLEAQCRGYKGPLSAAIYLPLPTTGAMSPVAAVKGDDAGDGEAPLAVTLRPARANVKGGDVMVDRKGVGKAAAKGRGTNGLADRRSLLGTDDTAIDKLMLRQHGAQLSAAREKIQAFFDRVQVLRANHSSSSSLSPVCDLRLMLFAERVSDLQLAAIMPTNVLRNAAALAAQTDLVAMLDADLGVSATFNMLVSDVDRLRNLFQEAAERPALYVVPAFEPNPLMEMETANGVSDAALSGSKADLIALWSNSTVKVFHVDGCRQCHKQINHMVWARSNESYEVHFARNFEPWGILPRFKDPGYDERFRGWAFDKIQHVESLALFKDFRFVILPDVWIIHRPHPKVAIARIHAQHQQTRNSKEQQEEGKSNDQVNVLLEQELSLKDGRTGTAYKFYMSYVHSLIRAERSVLEGSNRAKYGPQLNPQLLYCKSKLPWWQSPTLK